MTFRAQSRSWSWKLFARPCITRRCVDSKTAAGDCFMLRVHCIVTRRRRGWHIVTGRWWDHYTFLTQLTTVTDRQKCNRQRGDGAVTSTDEGRGITHWTSHQHSTWASCEHCTQWNIRREHSIDAVLNDDVHTSYYWCNVPLRVKGQGHDVMCVR